ncbi:helix-turn-helix transcriptional regulator [Thermoactinomyces sp. CICC 10523]|uniref:helix-turn-helix transcriptional regulator n=1 Tax=Thermoactinomyces sp. CICC 10523 TaxID=2767428 RepID=UPI0018DD5557|nr:helix-turn-helix transcriptional regulator [Thermoactinomyces sp. CICC 10523]MBH8597300.1 helix-turn-helix transcriptional regulator [Thermoactinomyces sp. CICC 10523]
MHRRNWLIQIRSKSKMTQNEVSKKAGISRSGYSNIEIGARNPSVESAQKIAKVLGSNWTIFFKADCFDMKQKDSV